MIIPIEGFLFDLEDPDELELVWELAEGGRVDLDGEPRYTENVA
jgi:hypothetical protein